jgi:hypothetical protein
VLAETSDILFSGPVRAWSLSLHELVEIKRAIAEIQPRTYPTPDNRRLQVRQKWRLYFDMIVWAF